jgi:hypothetical protein
VLVAVIQLIMKITAEEKEFKKTCGWIALDCVPIIKKN